MQPLIALYIVDGITALLLLGGLFICARKGLFGLFAYPAGLLGSFLFEYQLFSPAYGLAMGALSGLLPVLSDPAVYAAAEIVFSVLYETFVFTVIALVCRRRMRFSTAGAFGFGWWSCFALFTLVSRASDLISGEEYLFVGTALDVFLSRVTIPLSLGLYMFLALSACRCVAEGRIIFLIRAFLVALLYRGVLALPTFFPFSEAVAVALTAILAFRMLSVLIGHGIASDFFAGGLKRGASGSPKTESLVSEDAVPLPDPDPKEEDAGEDPRADSEEDPEPDENEDVFPDEEWDGEPEELPDEESPLEPRMCPAGGEEDAPEQDESGTDPAGDAPFTATQENAEEGSALGGVSVPEQEVTADSGDEDPAPVPVFDPETSDLLRREEAPEEEPMFDLFEKEGSGRGRRKGLFGGKRRNA